MSKVRVSVVAARRGFGGGNYRRATFSLRTREPLEGHIWLMAGRARAGAVLAVDPVAGAVRLVAAEDVAELCRSPT